MRASKRSTRRFVGRVNRRDDICDDRFTVESNHRRADRARSAERTARCCSIAAQQCFSPSRKRFGLEKAPYFSGVSSEKLLGGGVVTVRKSRHLPLDRLRKLESRALQ